MATPDRMTPEDGRHGGARAALVRVVVPVAVVSCLLVVLGRANYLAFHALVELFSIAVAWSVFLLTWNVRRVTRDDAMVFLGAVFAAVGLLDLLHTLSYTGMRVFPSPAAPNLPTQLWIATRGVEGLGLLIWALVVGRSFRPGAAVVAVAAVTIAVAAAIFSGRFPACYVEGAGLTPFKIAGEYATSGLLAVAVVVLGRRGEHVHPEVRLLLSAALIVKILAGLAFTLYVDVFGYTNMVGHILKVMAVTLVYLALVRAGLTRPYDVLLHRYLRRDAALNAVSGRWRAFLAHAQWPMAVVDARGTYREVNPAAEAMIGRPSADIVGRGFAELLPPAAARRLDEHLASVAADGGPVSARDLVRRDDGGESIYESTVFAVSSGDDDPLYGLIMRDVTDRVAEESRYARLVETAMDGFWLVDNDGIIVEANQAAADMLGHTVGELQGRSIADVEAEEDPHEVERHFARVREQGRDRFETRHRRKDGSVIDVEVCTSVVRGDRPGAVAFIRDVTGRKRSEQLLACRLRLSEYAFDHTLGELLQYTLDEAERMTGSSIGFLHFMEEDQAMLSLQRWSTNTLQHMCTAEGAGAHYPVSQAGVWADCVRERAPVIHNDYASLPSRRGLPAGHAEVVREVVVPVIRHGRVMAILGVGNKASEYTEADVLLVSQLADLAWDIAGSKRAQVELSESEDRYRSLFEHLLDPVLVIDAETLAIIDANRSARVRYGLAEGDQAVGNAVNLHVEAERREAAGMLRGGEAGDDLIWRHLGRDGASFPVRISTSLMTTRGRRQIVAIARDVSAELKAELEQRERLAHLNSLLAGISDVITILDPDGCIRFESPNIEARFGYGAQERTGRSMLGYVHADDRGLLRDALGRVAAAAGARESLELRALKCDGTPRTVEAVLRNLTADEQVGGILFNFRDVTDKRLAEDRFRLAFETSPDGISITTVADGVYVDVNQGFLELSGFTREEIVGRRSVEIGIWPSDEERRKLTDPLRTQGVAHNVEINYGRKNGERRIGLISANYISLGGEPHILAITRDITQLRRAEQERLQLEHQLQQAQKLESVGRLAGGIAHDFNNLLTVISGNAELARLTLGDDHPVTAEIDMISRTAERAAALTGQLLAYSREQASEPRPLSLRDLVLSDMRLVQRMIGEEVELVTDCPPSRHLVLADPVQVQQVLFNLCVNARDAMPEGGRLTVATRDVFNIDRVCSGCGERFLGDYTELSVRDTGTGIPAEHLDRIFDPFFTTKEVGKGTGMGLATALGIVTKSDGHIMASSTPDRGTTFRVYLPHHHLPVAAGVGADRGGLVSGRGERILVVEDDPGVQTTIVSVLERFGYRVSMAQDPLAALALLEQAGQLPDLVLSDVVMPRMNGEQLLQEMRARAWPTPFLFMSGYPADLLHGRNLLAPGRPYLRKPVAPADLLRAVREQLDGVGDKVG